MSLRWSLGYLAIPGVLALIFFLAFSSQWLFSNTEPGPLTAHQSVQFNGLVAALLVCYARAVMTDPGHVPADWKPDRTPPDSTASRQRWCRKCNAHKPPRAHHCKICQRCIPKMDHHCPWTVNCVSHVTYPHFLRFVGYADAAMLYLEYFLFVRASVVWENRDMPSYLGPTVFQLVHLFLLIIVNSLTLFALGILFIRALWCLVVNTYTIEGWEIERHEVLLRRARTMGGYLDGPDGTKVRIVKQEFPYDIGFWNNIVQGMGTSNVLAWFWPFAASPSNESGLHYETNGFEDPSLSWPPPDPDRMPRGKVRYDPAEEAAFNSGFSNDEIDAFRQRQQRDYARLSDYETAIRRRQKFHRRYDADDEGSVRQTLDEELSEGEEGEESWATSEGDRLADYGVDEEIEFYDEEDLPLSELLKRRQTAAS
ncbi:uncharacterized protein PV09_04810 [Verruconis gallopava]|uniref:Palmitoyltransferase PFA4 n=1 Tax=Verruconis gallopava TaxID=253628 RepID=A0A0D1YTK9_9PEZI|nr:uncharacterized protein PV09_04810 [Verruconis gallopava]KIW03977.1 hypothetical protein PV09_04810 [Verruconis gallopava]